MPQEERPESDHQDTERPTLPPRTRLLGDLTFATGAASGDDATLPPKDPNATLASHNDSVEVSIGGRIKYVSDYELLEEIARGGMGVVYRARQVNLNRIVALKMILAGQLAGEEDVQRFYAEAEAAAQLDHSGIVPIYETGEFDGQHYFSMAFIEAESLQGRIRNGPMEPIEAAKLCAKIAQAIG